MQLFLAFVNRPFNELQRVGRSDAYASSYNLESETYVPLPKDDVHKRKELVQDVTLDDLDAANALHQRGQDIMSGIGSLMKGSRRREVNKVQSRSELRLSYVDQGVAEVVPGVVFIDEVHILQVHMLDIEYFTYFNALFESPNGPYRDSCHQPWYSYSDQVVKVVQLRAITEGLKLGEGVIDRLAEGEKSSFR